MQRSSILAFAVAGAALVAACDEAAPPAGAAAPVAQAAVPLVTYDCEPALPLTVRYDNAAGADGQAIVTFSGKTFTLDHAVSGSGVRYMTSAGRTPGSTLVWWNKGRGGTLSEGSSANPDTPEKTIATCNEAGAVPKR